MLGSRLYTVADVVVRRQSGISICWFDDKAA